MTWTKERSRLANLSKAYSPDSPEVVSARRDLRFSRCEAYIEQAVSASPPFTNEQREKLALLLRGSLPSGGAAA